MAIGLAQETLDISGFIRRGSGIGVGEVWDHDLDSYDDSAIPDKGTKA